MLLLCNPERTMGLHGNSTEGFFLKKLYCLECLFIYKLDLLYME